jgi:hypothetical protein
VVEVASLPNNRFERSRVASSVSQVNRNFSVPQSCRSPKAAEGRQPKFDGNRRSCLT